MPKKYLIPKPQAAYTKWHDTLTGGVTATTPGATAEDVIMLAADNAALHTKLTTANQSDLANAADHKDLNGIIASSKTNAAQLAQRIKKSTGYTETLGAKLNLVGPEDCTDMTKAQATLHTTVKMGGVVEVGFPKLDAEGVHIYGQRDGETGFTYLGSETHSPYVDNRPLLVPGKTETRQYKAVFFIGKAEIGLPSDIATAIAAP
jgi:hypothetical protein